jgi:exodeoxyribonuclease V alpha subunit
MPEIPEKGGESDFFVIDRDDPDQITATLIEMVKKDSGQVLFRCDTWDSSIVPDEQRQFRIRELNMRLQAELNPARPDEPWVEKFGWQFRPRDKTIQTENDYDKDVFNGDVGQIVKIDPVEKEVTVRFDQREAVYDFGELDEVS